jgi:hypothetical protein
MVPYTPAGQKDKRVASLSTLSYMRRKFDATEYVVELVL